MELATLINKKNSDFNEEQTKHSLVLPILDKILGWDVYDEKSVIPEYTADSPGKSGERVDYALDLEGDGNVEILIEVKPLGSRLNDRAAEQLYRYFAVIEASVGVLTDGFRWMIFTDLEKVNIMDREPFLNFTLEDLAGSSSLESFFKCLSRDGFDTKRLKAWGADARDSYLLDKLVIEEMKCPSDELTKLFFRKIYPNQAATSQRLNDFRSLLKDSFAEQREEYKPFTQDIVVPATEYKKPERKKTVHRKGYLVDDKGHVSAAGSTKAAWVDFWTIVAKDPAYRDLLYKFAAEETLGSTFSSSPSVVPSGATMNTEIAPNLWVYTNDSYEGRDNRLDKAAAELDLKIQIIYTD